MMEASSWGGPGTEAFCLAEGGAAPADGTGGWAVRHSGGMATYCLGTQAERETNAMKQADQARNLAAADRSMETRIMIASPSPP
jgi:hypothetical protein